MPSCPANGPHVRAGIHLALFAVAMLVGCGGVNKETGDAGSQDASVAIDSAGEIDALPPDLCVGAVALGDFFACLDRTICEILMECLSPFLTIDDCVDFPFAIYAELPEEVLSPWILEAVAAGTMEYNAESAGDCLSVLAQTSCSEALVGPSLLDRCSMLTGTVAAGGSCLLPEECSVLGSRCEREACPADLCCAGRCVSPVPLFGGCSADEECEPGAHCVLAAGTSKCEAGEAPASPCNSDGDCDSDHWCRGDGLCKADFPSGSNCSSDAQCPGVERCIGDDLAAGSGRCGSVSQVGDSCDGVCLGTIWCNQNETPGQEGTCESLPELGESCSESRRCKSSLQLECFNGTCSIRGADMNATCSARSDCRVPLYCTAEITGDAEGTCQAAQSAGAICTDDYQCSSGRCPRPAGGSGACVDYDSCY